MAEQDDELPEGTDKVVAGAAVTENEEALIVREPTARDKAIDKLKTGGEKLSGQAADKARGLVGQGLERSSEALANVSKLVGDTAAGLDERLGAEGHAPEHDGCGVSEPSLELASHARRVERAGTDGGFASDGLAVDHGNDARHRRAVTAE